MICLASTLKILLRLRPPRLRSVKHEIEWPFLKGRLSWRQEASRSVQVCQSLWDGNIKILSEISCEEASGVQNDSHSQSRKLQERNKAFWIQSNISQDCTFPHWKMLAVWLTGEETFCKTLSIHLMSFLLLLRREWSQRNSFIVIPSRNPKQTTKFITTSAQPSSMIAPFRRPKKSSHFIDEKTFFSQFEIGPGHKFLSPFENPACLGKLPSYSLWNWQPEFHLRNSSPAADWGSFKNSEPFFILQRFSVQDNEKRYRTKSCRCKFGKKWYFTTQTQPLRVWRQASFLFRFICFSFQKACIYLVTGKRAAFSFGLANAAEAELTTE